MYERFTDRSRKVMQLANEEAQRLNHEYIGTEHILLGLAKEGKCIASMVLHQLNIDVTSIRKETERVVQQGPPTALTSNKLPQTPRAKKIIDYAIEEARNMNHGYVGTEHILLGLVREEQGVAYMVLDNLGVTTEKIRENCLDMLGVSAKENDDTEDYARLRDDICCVIISDLSEGKSPTHTISEIVDLLDNFNTN